jgi:hypothetical protein
LPEFYIWKKKYENGRKNTFSFKFMVNHLPEFYIWKKKCENGGESIFSFRQLNVHLSEGHVSLVSPE